MAIDGWAALNCLVLVIHSRRHFVIILGTLRVLTVSTPCHSSPHPQPFPIHASCSQWNTAQLTNMKDMFRSSEAFNADISSFNTAKVKNMNRVLNNAYAFTHSAALLKWDISTVTDVRVGNGHPCIVLQAYTYCSLHLYSAAHWTQTRRVRYPYDLNLHIAYCTRLLGHPTSTQIPVPFLLAHSLLNDRWATCLEPRSRTPSRAVTRTSFGLSGQQALHSRQRI